MGPTVRVPRKAVCQRRDLKSAEDFTIHDKVGT